VAYLLTYLLFVLTVAAEASYRQWHCDDNLSRAWCFAIHTQVYSLSVPACVHHCPSSSNNFWFHGVQARGCSLL